MRPGEALVNRIATEHLPVIHSRGGFDFLIESGEFSRRIGSFAYFAKVKRVVSSGNPDQDVLLGQLPFRPIEHWGIDRANAVAKAIKQIDDWFDAHR